MVAGAMIGAPDLVTGPGPVADVEGAAPRYRIVVAYDGSAYHGFQLQAPVTGLL
jgi:hypothetical protein